MAEYDLADKVVIITGAAGGIGAAVARGLLAKGSKLVLVDVEQAKLDAMAAAMSEARVLALAADVSDKAAMKRVAERTVETFGRIDVVFANAAITTNPPATCVTADPEEMDRVLQVNLLGVWRTVQPCLAEIVKNQGYVLCTSSIYAFANGMANAPYAISKAGVEALCRALRAELAHTGAKAGTLYPGWVSTNIAKVALGGHDLATSMVARGFPGPLRRPTTADKLAVDIVAGMEKRAARIISPRIWAAVSMLRGLVNMLTDHQLEHDRTMQGFLKDLEAEVRGRQPPAIVEKADAA